MEIGYMVNMKVSVVSTSATSKTLVVDIIWGDVKSLRGAVVCNCYSMSCVVLDIIARR